MRALTQILVTTIHGWEEGHRTERRALFALDEEGYLWCSTLGSERPEWIHIPGPADDDPTVDNRTDLERMLDKLEHDAETRAAIEKRLDDLPPADLGNET